MITERDLREAIAECQGERNPNANTCIKLAAYYTILNNMEVPQGVSFESKPDTVSIDSVSEFAAVANGKDLPTIWNIMDELMVTLQLVNPRLYDSVIRKISDRG